jgi:hypothetical protein
MTQLRAVAWVSIAVFTGIGAAQAETPTVHVENAAARVIVVPEPRTDISVAVSAGESKLPVPSVRQEGSVTIVDGGLDPRHLECGGGIGSRRITLPTVGSVAVSSLPLITIHAPEAVSVAATGGVWGEVGATKALSLSNEGCGEWRVGDVEGRLALKMGGSGDVAGGVVGTLDIESLGSADVKLNSVKDAVTDHHSGSGDVEIGAVGGALHLLVAGSGDTKLGSVGGDVDAKIRGSGNLTADTVSGAIQASIAGSGTINIKGGHTPRLEVNVAGSGDFAFHGTADAVAATTAGSGDITVAHATGPVSKSIAGSGSISIGG